MGNGTGSMLMAEMVTLEVSEGLARQAREVAQSTGREVEAIFQEWLERGAAGNTISGLVPGTEYTIFTPYGNEAAAQVLMDVLARHEAEDMTTPDSQ